MRAWATLLALLVAVVTSAIGLIALQHDGRQLFIALEQAGRETDRAQAEWSRLQIELAWLGETGRIERQARERLDMTSPDNVGVLVADHD